MDLCVGDDVAAEGPAASKAQLGTEDEIAADGPICGAQLAATGPTFDAKTVSNLSGGRGNPKALMRGLRVLP